MSKIIATYSICNTGGICIHEIAGDAVLASMNDGEQEWCDIVYAPSDDEESEEFEPVFYFGAIKVPISQCLRTDIGIVTAPKLHKVRITVMETRVLERDMELTDEEYAALQGKGESDILRSLCEEVVDSKLADTRYDYSAFDLDSEKYIVAAEG